MQSLNINEIREIQLSILRSVDTFCREKGLRYSLTGGSLIGSVRHGGYIPWDDDIDLMMPRPDYEKFLSGYISSENKVINLMHSGLCVETFAKVERIGTIMKDKLLGRELWGINVDIFPIDGMPDENTRQHFDKLEALNSRLGTFCPFYKSVEKNRFKWILKYIAKRIIHFYPHSFLHLKKTIESELLKTQFGQTSFSALFCGGYGWCEVMPTSVFETYEDVQFENSTVRRIVEYDRYLQSEYGDYLQLPPVEQRIPKHDYDYYVI